MEPILAGNGSWLGLVGSVGLLLVSHVANKYVIPFLKVGKRDKYARYIAVIADEVTSDIRARYPGEEWLEHLDEAVEALIRICGISEETARRAIHASADRN